MTKADNKPETKVTKRKETKRSEKVLPDALVPESQWEILGSPTAHREAETAKAHRG